MQNESKPHGTGRPTLRLLRVPHVEDPICPILPDPDEDEDGAFPAKRIRRELTAHRNALPSAVADFILEKVRTYGT